MDEGWQEKGVPSSRYIFQRRSNSCDYFASDFMHRMKPFRSRYKCEGSAGVDAFTAVWRGNGFFHPLLHKMVEIVRYAKVQKARGILVTPYWQGAAFGFYLEKEEGVVMRRKFRPLLRRSLQVRVEPCPRDWPERVRLG